ncbi:MAG: cell division protein FtsL [Candidatus Saccharibacteria bacterium]|nr:cell division protein FtsL [Moraxellaceae bacterium]
MKKPAANSPSSFRIALIDAILVSVLVAGVIGSALSVAFQVNATRDEFKVLQKSKQIRDQLDVEWGRLLIEQQTFGATSQIGSRAVIYLHMFSPPANQVMTLEIPNKHLTATSQFSVAPELPPIDGAMPATSQGVEP